MNSVKKAWAWLKWVLGAVGLLILGILFIPKAVGRKVRAQKEMSILRAKKEVVMETHDWAIKDIDSENSKAVAVIISKRDKKLIAVDNEIAAIRTEAKKGPVALAKEWTAFLKERDND